MECQSPVVRESLPGRIAPSVCPTSMLIVAPVIEGSGVVVLPRVPDVVTVWSTKSRTHATVPPSAAHPSAHPPLTPELMPCHTTPTTRSACGLALFEFQLFSAAVSWLATVAPAGYAPG